MKSNWFFKHLIDFINYSITIMIGVVPLTIGYVTALRSGSKLSWIVLLMILSLIISYLLIGAYWFLQYTKVDKEGIKVYIFNIKIQDVKWTQIKKIKFESLFRKPVYRFELENSKPLKLEIRKKVTNTLKYYCDDSIKKMIDNIYLDNEQY